MRNSANAVSVLTGVTMLIGMSEGAAAAVTTPQTDNFSLSDTTPSFSPGTLSFSATDELTFDPFDSNLGTLTGVLFSWTPTSDIDPDIGAYAETSDPYTLDLSIDGDFSIIANSLGVTTLSDSNETMAEDSCSATNGEGCVFAVESTGSYDDSLSPGGLGDYQAPGGGSFTVDFALAAVSTAVAEGGGLNLTLPYEVASAVWNGEFTVEFTYDPTAPSDAPEPGTLGLLGVSLAGLGAAARRRRPR